MSDPQTYNLYTGEPDPVGHAAAYITPHERAVEAHDQAQTSMIHLSEQGQLDPQVAMLAQYGTALFEMLTAIHEQVETTARNTASSASDDALSAMLERLTGATGGARDESAE